MYSTTDWGLPYWENHPESEHYSNIPSIKQIDIDALVFGIQRPVIRAYRNMCNDLLPY